MKKEKRVKCMKTKLTLALLFAIILSSSTYVAIGQAWYNSTYPWSQSQYDAQHTAASDSTSPSSNSTAWIFQDNSYGQPSGLVVGDGRVFGIRTDGGSLFVLDETTGVRIVDTSIGLRFNAMPAYSDGKVYLTSGNWIYGSGSVRCYNATTGDELWNYDTTPGPIYHPPTVSGNRVYVGASNNYTYCIEDGMLKWYEKLGGPTQSAPAIDGSLFCIGCDDGKVYAFNVTGDQPVSLWNFTAGVAIRSPITIQGDKVYSAGNNGCLYVLDRTNGQLIWSWQSPNSGALAIAVAYGIVYVSPNVGSGLYALYSNVTAGNYTYTSPEPRVWADGTTWGARFGIAIAGGKLFYVEGNTNLVRARDAFTGTNLWSQGSMDGTAIVADGHVFVTGNDKVYCFGEPYPPVTNTYKLNVGGQPFAVDIETNSTVGSIDVSNITTTMNISFTVENNRGTSMCNITLPNDMLGGPYSVTVDGQSPWSSATTPVNATHTSVYFTYNGTGKYTVQVIGSTVIPEFTLPITIVLCGIITVAIIGFRKRRLFT